MKGEVTLTADEIAILRMADQTEMKSVKPALFWVVHSLLRRQLLGVAITPAGRIALGLAQAQEGGE